MTIVDCELISLLRMQAGLSLAGLARTAGISRSTVIQFERGRPDHVSLAATGRIAAALGVSVPAILKGEAPMAPPARDTTDGNHLLVLLFYQRRTTWRSVILGDLGWNNERLDAALDIADSLLTSTPYHVRRLTNGALRLSVRPQFVFDPAAKAAGRRRLSRAGLDRQQTRVLHAIVWSHTKFGNELHADDARFPGSIERLIQADVLVWNKPGKCWKVADDFYFALEPLLEIRDKLDAHRKAQRRSAKTT